MNNVSHKNNCNVGVLQQHVGPLPIPLIKLIRMISWTRIFFNLYCVGIRRQLRRNSMSFKLPCLTMGSGNIFCCLFATSILLLQCQECWGSTRRCNIFVRLSVDKCYTSLNCCLLTWKVRTL